MKPLDDRNSNILSYQNRRGRSGIRARSVVVFLLVACIVLLFLLRDFPLSAIPGLHSSHRNLSADQVRQLLNHLAGSEHPVPSMAVAEAEGTNGFGADVKWILLKCNQSDVAVFKNLIVSQASNPANHLRLGHTDRFSHLATQDAPTWWDVSQLSAAEFLSVEVLGGRDDQRVSVAYWLAFAQQSGRVYLLYYGG
jgi:hypothetical protein